MEPLVPEFLVEASCVFARAFVNDPLYVFLFPDEGTRKRKIECLYRFLLRIHMIHTWVSSSLLEGVAIWEEPYDHRGFTNVFQFIRGIGLMFCLRPGALRRIILFAWKTFLLRKKFMSTEAFYLRAIAVDPPCQKKGVGSVMIQELLKKADHSKSDVFLETQNGANIAFYERFGFCVIYQTRYKGLEHIIMRRKAKDAPSSRKGENS